MSLRSLPIPNCAVSLTKDSSPTPPERRALVTENVADFMPLATQWAGQRKPHSGLIFTNPKRFNRATLAYPGNLIASLCEFLTDPPIIGESWIWWL